MRQKPATADVRRASGLPEPHVLRIPERTARVGVLVDRLPSSAVLPGLVHLLARVAGTTTAQLSLLGEQQSALVACDGTSCATSGGPLEDSLCTVTLLSGDVLVAADARTHPWLHDLPPVRSGDVGRYLGVPLRLGDGTTVGAACAFDREPKAWTQEQVTRACDVADVVAVELQRLVELGSGAPPHVPAQP